MIEAVARLWDSSLTDLDAERWAEELRRRRVDHVPSFPRPLFLTRTDWQVLDSILVSVTSALLKVLRAWVDGAFEDLVPLSPDLRALVSLDLHADPQGFWRYDLAYGGGCAHVLECNAGDPSGMGWVDDMRAALQPLEAMRRCVERYSATLPSLVDAHRRMLADRFPHLPPRVAFHCAEDTFIRGDHDSMAVHYREAGWQASVGDPREFRWDGRHLWLRGEQVTLVCRDNLDEFTLPPYRREDVANAYRAGAVGLINPFCALVGDYKALFEVLTDSFYGDLFDAQEREVLARHVPWTRLVRAALGPDLRHRRRELVLKPNYGYGGNDILIGHQLEQSVWDAAVDRAIEAEGAWVAQAYLELPHAFGRPAVVSGWVHGGRFVGALARVSEALVVNVHRGGGLVPVAFVDA